MNTPLINLPLVAIESIDLEVLARTVAWFDNRPHLARSKIYEAAKALQEALTYERHETAQSAEAQKDSESISQALMAIEYTRKTGSIGWAVKRGNLPRMAKTGDVVTIDYVSGGKAKVVAEVSHLLEYPEGRALILRLLETHNSFGLSASGWRYIGFWIPNRPTESGGFTFRTEAKPAYVPPVPCAL